MENRQEQVIRNKSQGLERRDWYIIAYCCEWHQTSREPNTVGLSFIKSNFSETLISDC